MSLIKVCKDLETPRTKTKKIISLQNFSKASSSGRSVSRSIMTESMHGDTKECAHLKLYRQYRSRSPNSTGHMGDSRLPAYHYLMEQILEKFLSSIDDVFISFNKNSPTDVSGYKDICEKLRAEILIAMDRLEFLAYPNTLVLDDQSEFFKKMNYLKSQLSELRWNYHNAIKELGSKIY